MARTNHLAKQTNKVRVDFDFDEVNLIQHALSEAILDLERRKSPLVEPEQFLLTRIRLATTILMHAECGEWDANKLKEAAIAYVQRR